MTHLKCKRVPHPLYSLDLAIADFYLFDVLKQKPQGIDVGDGEELKSDILTIFHIIPSDELKSHSITESKDASGLTQMQETIRHHRDET
jgi:hypothetical protein